MGKKITSKIKGWKGTVTLSDPLFLPQVLALRKAVRGVEELGENVPWDERMMIYLPTLLGCIEDWSIKSKDHPTAETFPMVGTGVLIANSIEFINLLQKEIWALFSIVEDDNPES